MLAEFRDYVKTFDVGDHFSIGKIDSSKDKSIGIYGDSNSYRIEAIGKDSKYDIANMRILVHWNKNLAETEAASKSLYEQLRYQKDFDMNNIHVHYVDLIQGEPLFVGTDANGIYEYVITLRIFYRRNINE